MGGCMMERFVWPLVLVATVLLLFVEPAPCVAQSQPPSTPAAMPAPTPVPPANRVRAADQPQADPLPATAQPRAPLPPPRRVQVVDDAGSSGDSARGLAMGELAVRLRPAPLEPTDLRFPINLATALRLSDARPLIVAAAQAGVWVAEAQLTRAKVLWVPTLNIGFDYIRHDGGGPDFNKGIMTAPSVNFFYGGGGLIAERRHDRCHLPAPGRAAGPEFPASRHPDREERRPVDDGRCLLPGAPVSGNVCRRPLLRRAGARPGRADLAVEQGAGPQGRGRSGQELGRRPRAAGHLGARSLARPQRQPHPDSPA